MNDFDLRIQVKQVVAGGTIIPMLIVGPQKELWFRGNNLTAYLGYAQPRVALTKIVKSRNTKTFAELLPQVVSNMETTPVDDQKPRYVNEPGLYRLIARSTMDKAELFQDWVYEVVLPSIRKTSAYSVQPTTLATDQCDGWLQKQVEGKDLMRLKNATLQQLIDGGFGQIEAKLYAIAANHINQAVLGYTETTVAFKKQQQLPRHISIPDILNMQGQVARCYAETCYQKFVSDNLQRLRGMSQQDLIKEFTELKLSLRQGFVSTGMGDLQTKMLTQDEASKRKKEQKQGGIKRQKLLQAHQPKMIECAAGVIGCFDNPGITNCKSKVHHLDTCSSVSRLGFI